MPSFPGAIDPNNPLLSTPGALTETPVPMGPQTCWKSCGTLPSKKVELLSLLPNSVHFVAEVARRQLDQFKGSRLLRAPRLANLVAMFGQFIETLCFFLEC